MISNTVENIDVTLVTDCNSSYYKLRFILLMRKLKCH